MAETNRAGCIYCGERPLTREHVLPQWMNQLMGAGPDEERPRLENSSRVSTGIVADDLDQFPSWGLQQIVKIVCASCNNGWMSSLEGSVKEPLTALATGGRCSLDGPVQLLVAAWATKTALMISARFSGTAMRRILVGAGFNNQHEAPYRPGVNCIVRLARRNPSDAQIQCLALAAHNAAEREPVEADGARSNSTVVTIGIGELAIQVVAGVASGRPFTAPTAWPLVIWPLRNNLEWPPATPWLDGEAALMKFHKEPIGTLLNNDFDIPLLLHSE